jgi:CRP-like cAMP-binding protein
MKNFYDVLKGCDLFSEMTEAELQALLACRSAGQSGFKKGGFIFFAHDPAARVGVVIEGGVHVIQEDYWGNRTILAHIGQGGMFGEAFSCAGVVRLPVSVIAASETNLLMIDLKRVVTICSSACEYHTRLIKNLLRALAKKNLSLIQKMEHITRRTTREKLLSFLSAQAKDAGNSSFEISFNRQELADYLAVDRSAMSAELSKIRNEGLLRYERNHFILELGPKKR